MNIDMIRAAETRARGHIRLTPMLSSPRLDAIAGRRVLVKAENLQHTGSFKARGAWAAVTALATGARPRPMFLSCVIVVRFMRRLVYGKRVTMKSRV